ncbi:ribonuclease III [Candidatus Saccharibacteria bacterium]|nr:ribonuclease III [Candidatus Saccharibacteria bacterium]
MDQKNAPARKPAKLTPIDATVTKAQIEEYRKYAREKLGAEFKDIGLLITAFTHRSYVNEHRKIKIEHNERLEFLGDAILEMVVTDYIYRNFHQNEGVMTSWRSALVRTEANAAAGEELGYESLIRLSHGERDGLVARAHLTIMADCYEAVIGALYIDQGYEFASNFIKEHTLSKLKGILQDESWRDPKSHFQELVQHFDGGAVPHYHTLRVEGPDHNREYTVALFVGDHKVGEATGNSKQQAQVELAKRGVEMYRLAGKTLPIIDMDNL